MRRSLLVLFLLVLGLSILPSPSHAQVSRADSAAVLLGAARAFQAEGRREVAEALFQYISERFGDTPGGIQAVEALRTPQVLGPTRSSQVELQVWSTLYGTWLGMAIPAALGADEPGPYGAGLLAGGAAGFFAGRMLGKSRPLSEGQVRAITFGSLWGSWQGFGWAEVADGGEEMVCEFDVCYVNDSDAETIIKSMVVGGLAGIATGAILARKPIPAGVATSANFGAFWGSWLGVAGGVLADMEGDGLLSSTLLVGNAGIVAGAVLGSKWELSRNRARLISLAGVVGGVGGAGLDLLIQPDDEKTAIAIPLVTSLTGLVLGAVLTSDDGGGAGFGAGGRGAGDVSSREDLGLVQLRDGRLGFGTPAPFLTAMQVDTDRGPTWRPGLGLNLFGARF